MNVSAQSPNCSSNISLGSMWVEIGGVLNQKWDGDGRVRMHRQDVPVDASPDHGTVPTAKPRQNDRYGPIESFADDLRFYLCEKDWQRW